MHPALTIVLAALFALPATAQSETDELRAARALFEANLGAIRDRDRDAYLATYLRSKSLARTGPEGFSLGWEGLAEGAGSAWPDTFEARDLRLVRVQPGVVYGTYRYRVRYGADEHAGLSERLFVRTDGGWKIAMTSAFDSPAGTPPPPVAIVGGTMVTPGRDPVRDAVIVVRNGRIDCAGSRAACEVPPGIDRVDARGLWITPGLVDAHVHYSQTGWADGRPDALDLRERHDYSAVQAELQARPERFHRSWLCSGVTAVFDVGGYPWTLAMAHDSPENRRAPHVVAAGPLLSTIDFWLNLPAARQFIFMKDEPSVREGVRYLAAAGSDAVKVWYIVTRDRDAADLAPLVLAAGEEAAKAGLPLIVHATGLEEAKVAARAGSHLLVHGVGDRPVDDELVSLLRASGTIYTPTLTVARGYLRMAEGVASRTAPAIDDPNRCVDPQTRAKIESTATVDPSLVDSASLPRRREGLAARERVGAANLARLHRAGIPVAMGTDAGNPLTLHGPSVHAEMEAMQQAGMTPLAVLEAATRGGAAAMGREHEIGSIEKDRIADLLLVAADPAADVANLRAIRMVVRGGVVRTIEELSEIARSEE